MAGGPLASCVVCHLCGRRAERTSEGLETDAYRCSGGHGFSIHFKQGPAKSALWPARGQDREVLEVLAAQKGWDLAAIDAEAALLAPPPPSPAGPPRPLAEEGPAAREIPTPTADSAAPPPSRTSFGVLGGALGARWSRFTAALVGALAPRAAPPTPRVPDATGGGGHRDDAPTVSIAAWLLAESPSQVEQAQEWLVASARAFSRSAAYAKEHFAGGDWSDFSSYKGNERWSDAFASRLHALDTSGIRSVAELLVAAETLIEETSGDPDYDAPEAARRSALSWVEQIRTHGAAALTPPHD